VHNILVISGTFWGVKFRQAPKKPKEVRKSKEKHTFKLRMLADATQPTEGCWNEEPTARDDSLLIADPPNYMRRRGSMPDIGRRETPTTALHRLVRSPPGDYEEPRQRVATAPIYLFAARVRSATTSPRPTDALHTFAAKDNTPHIITRRPPELRSVSQKTFARSSAAPRARPCSPATCAEDKD